MTNLHQAGKIHNWRHVCVLDKLSNANNVKICHLSRQFLAFLRSFLSGQKQIFRQHAAMLTDNHRSWQINGQLYHMADFSAVHNAVMCRFTHFKYSCSFKRYKSRTILTLGIGSCMKNISYLKLNRVRKQRGTASSEECERSENPSNVYVCPLVSIVVGFSV